MRPWFKQAVASVVCWQSKSDSTIVVSWKQPVVTSIYTWGENLLYSVAHAFYTGEGCSDDNLIGVIMFDTTTITQSKHLKDSSPSVTSQSAVVQMFGEIVAATNFEVTTQGSSGSAVRLNVSATRMPRVNDYAVRLGELRDLGEIESVQNRTSIHGELIKSTAGEFP